MCPHMVSQLILHLTFDENYSQTWPYKIDLNLETQGNFSILLKNYTRQEQIISLKHYSSEPYSSP